MQLCEIINAIEKIAPLKYASAWDASGVQVATFSQTATHIAVMLDPSLASIESALAKGADCIISHHPLSMKPRFPNKADEYLRVLSLLLTRGVCLYSAHTSLDANPVGPAAWLAHDLGLVNVSLLAPEGNAQTTPCGPSAGSHEQSDCLPSSYGFGFTGSFPAPLSYESACRQIADAAGIQHWRSCGPKPHRVTTIACCPGSGSDLALVAHKAGADIFVTGDCKYHSALESPVCILDVGHFSLEEEMMRRFASQLHTNTGVPVTFIPAIDPFSFESI